MDQKYNYKIGNKTVFPSQIGVILKIAKNGIIPDKVVILDQQTLIRSGMRVLIKKQPGILVVGEAGQLDEAIELITNYQPDIILFELNLEDQFTTEIISNLLDAC